MRIESIARYEPRIVDVRCVYKQMLSNDFSMLDYENEAMRYLNAFLLNQPGAMQCYGSCHALRSINEARNASTTTYMHVARSLQINTRGTYARPASRLIFSSIRVRTRKSTK